MKISHEYKYIETNEFLYIYIDCFDKYEFGKELLNNSNNTTFMSKLKKYIQNNIDRKKKGMAVIVINGVVIGSIAISTLFNFNDSNQNTSSFYSSTPNQINVYKEKENIDNNEKSDTTSKANNSSETISNSNIKENKIEAKTDAESLKKADVKKNNNTNKTNSNSTKSSTKTASTSTSTNTNKPSSTTSTTTTTTPKTEVPSGTTIKLNTNGTVVAMNLEEYIIGVVAAEMPASFQLEALKAQAVAARTFAMKKASNGITLLNSTSHQVYKNEAQLKTLWGTSYNTYYNKVKNAVYSTKGQVMMYNGSYIDAMYFSMSNGKTELPVYVWSYSYPYLQCVSSTWDTSLSNFKVSTNINYENVSSKLGITVNKDTTFEILSYTPSERVEKMKIDETTFTGVQLRTLLNLRSTDITIVKHDTYITFVTKGYGHGVGMSQYGANGAAKEGYSYIKILKHYYPGITIVTK